MLRRACCLQHTAARCSAAKILWTNHSTSVKPGAIRQLAQARRELVTQGRLGQSTSRWMLFWTRIPPTIRGWNSAISSHCHNYAQFRPYLRLTWNPVTWRTRLSRRIRQTNMVTRLRSYLTKKIHKDNSTQRPMPQSWYQIFGRWKWELTALGLALGDSSRSRCFETVQRKKCAWPGLCDQPQHSSCPARHHLPVCYSCYHEPNYFADQMGRLHNRNGTSAIAAPPGLRLGKPLRVKCGSPDFQGIARQSVGDHGCRRDNHLGSAPLLPAVVDGMPPNANQDSARTNIPGRLEVHFKFTTYDFYPYVGIKSPCRS